MPSTASSPRPEVRPSTPFVVELERFQGPLDLLLHLIRSQDIDIFDIPIARITEQFRTALDAGIERLELNRAGEFLEMASTLVRIKAQLLLPRPGEPDWEEDPRSELVRRLLEYEHFHEAARLLSSREAERSRHHGKGYVEPRSAPDACLPELETGREALLEAVREVPEPAPDARARPPTRDVTVEEKASLLRRLLRSVKRLPFGRLFRPWGSRDHAIAALLACLEMARRQVVRIEQVELFGSIWLFPGDRVDEEPEDRAFAGVGDGPASPPGEPDTAAAESGPGDGEPGPEGGRRDGEGEGT